MANLFDDVRPGDLIKASVWNQVIHVIQSHEARIAALESETISGGGEVTIKNISPSPAHVGDTLTITGTNFGLPTSNTVTIAGTRVTQFLPGSGDTQLIVTIPNVQGVPQNGQQVTLLVGNPNGSAPPFIFTLLPAQTTIPTGELFVNLTQAPSDAQLVAGKTYNFIFTVTAITSKDETYALAPSVDVGWPVTALDNQNKPTTQLFIAQGNPPNGTKQTVTVQVTIPNGTATNTIGQLSLLITSMNNPQQLFKGSGNIPITVGSAAPPATDKIILSFNKVQAGGTFTNGTVNIPANNIQVEVDFTALIKDPGKYHIDLKVQGDPQKKWTPQLGGSSTLQTFTTNTNNLIMTGLSAAPGAQDAQFVLTVSSSDSPPAIAQFSQPIHAGT
jgi:hypothetical protein